MHHALYVFLGFRMEIEEFCVYLQRVLVRDIYLLLNFLSRITTSEKKTSKNPKTQRSRSIAQTSP